MNSQIWSGSGALLRRPSTLMMVSVSSPIDTAAYRLCGVSMYLRGGSSGPGARRG